MAKKTSSTKRSVAAKGFVNLADLQQLWAASNKVKTVKQPQTNVELWFERYRDSYTRKGNKMPAVNALCTYEGTKASRVSLSVGSALHFA